MSDFDPICATCGKPRSNHPYRHPFNGPSEDDRIEELEAKLAEVEAEHVRYLRTMEAKLFLAEERAEAAEAERDALLESGLAAYFAGSGDAKARERQAYKRGFRAALGATVAYHEELALKHDKYSSECLRWSEQDFWHRGAAERHRRDAEAIRAIPDSEGDDE